ncbi:Ig-like domain-containing protein [Flagellimonas sp.]|uniref:Ig-like domain-containing protein n=1 Tax=Flagellimonas sp. TaxID=2058762 RepID=UPI003F49D6FA
MIYLFSTKYKKIKFLLVFFCATLLFNCRHPESLGEIHLNYSDGRAISVNFEAEKSQEYKVFLTQNDLVPILGTYSHNNGIYTFTPVVAFTSGQTYDIRKNGKPIASFTIDKSSSEKAPELLAIYPSFDTVPQNLLKMYFVFSEPMQHSKSALDFIRVFDNTTQKETDVFLEMQTELWNKEHTRLTLWLDPGRIKTDLIPNREKGLPLLQNHNYTISIDSLWTSAQGNSLSKKYHRTISVVGKDLQRPNPKLWDIIVPEINTRNPLEIHFNEPMDAILVLETIQIRNSKDQTLEGTISLSENESKLVFKPIEKWTLGTYSIHVNPVLEDLAGNNLERLFDTDLQNATTIQKIDNTLTFDVVD